MTNYIPFVSKAPLLKGPCLKGHLNSYVCTKLFLWISEQYIADILWDRIMHTSNLRGPDKHDKGLQTLTGLCWHAQVVLIKHPFIY